MGGITGYNAAYFQAMVCQPAIELTLPDGTRLSVDIPEDPVQQENNRQQQKFMRDMLKAGADADNRIEELWINELNIANGGNVVFANLVNVVPVAADQFLFLDASDGDGIKYSTLDQISTAIGGGAGTGDVSQDGDALADGYVAMGGASVKSVQDSGILASQVVVDSDITNMVEAIGSLATASLVIGAGGKDVADASVLIDGVVEGLGSPAVGDIAVWTTDGNTDYRITGGYSARTIITSDEASAGEDYVVSSSPTLSAYSEGLEVYFDPNTTNTTSGATINIDSLGPKGFKLLNGSAIAAGDLEAGVFAHLIYDGTDFILTNPQ